MEQAIDTGDHVHHAPSNEDWVVAYVQGDRLAWCGWPEGEALLADCALIKKAEPEQRIKLLREMSEIPEDDARKRYAVWALAQEVSDEAAIVPVRTVQAGTAQAPQGDSHESTRRTAASAGNAATWRG